ncbi:MAG: Sorting nexin, cytoplasm-to-vacuole targeting pathway/endosomal sorting [Bathelium mastoideum]|nr:MAG: Sorting nexin, cytoplasm-to-vacuole targeting pathway/endosomal sorting [Bathelium mastoideum]
MWNDEDNNPYAAFDRRDSNNSDVAYPGSPSARFRQPSTPPSEDEDANQEPPEFLSRPRDLTDESLEDDQSAHQQIPPKRGGYNSRIEQILYENPDLQIEITYAGKNLESGGSYIAYTIRTGDLEVRRRYSEFASLRQTLVNLHPTLIIPPIPEKHTMADYAAKPTKAKEDAGIIELRKRMLAVFLNRCRKMKQVREDGVWLRFLDPNASWSEVLHAHPASSIPKNALKAPPLDPANPTPAHAFLPVPSASAKLKSSSVSSASGTPSSPPPAASAPSSAAHTVPGPQIFGRFPPSTQSLSEQDLDPYFINFESSSRELEQLLQGSMEKVNRRSLSHLAALGDDLAELGMRFNAFSLAEQAPSLATAIEKMGQAADATYIATRDLSSTLSAQFAEPMRESAQFAGVVRAVLRYRVLKRVQQDMTRDELERKRALLDGLERSELEARRIDQYLGGSVSGGAPQPTTPTPRRSFSTGSQRGTPDRGRRAGAGGDDTNPAADTESIDSDFPPTQGDNNTAGGAFAEEYGQAPSANQGLPARSEPNTPASAAHKKSPSSGGGSGNFVTNKIFGRINHAIHGIVDVDPERTRRDQIGKTREGLVQLEQALEVSERDVKDASAGVLQDLKRFQAEKEEDLKRYMVAYARCHVDWAKKNLQTWEEARGQVENIEIR